MEIIFQLKLLSGHAFFSDLGWNSGQSKFWSYVVPGQNFTRKLILFFLSTILLPSLKRKKTMFSHSQKVCFRDPKRQRLESNIQTFSRNLSGKGLHLQFLSLRVPNGVSARFPQFVSTISVCYQMILLNTIILIRDSVRH